MDHPGKELLTGAALPEQEHGRGAHRDLLRLLLRFQQGTALADHLRVLCLRELFLEDQILGDELPGLQRLPDDYQEMVRVHRLLQEIERPFLEDRKSTRLNSSHGYISYAVFCLKKKKHMKVFTHRISCAHNTEI